MGKYSVDDIDIYVLSYNRGTYLLETINCLLKQTIGNLKFTILDNASTGETAEIIKQIHNERINIIVNPENIGGLENIKKAQELASKQWTIIFHDDDLINYYYIERVLDIINSKSDVTMVAALTKLMDNPRIENAEHNLTTDTVVYKNVSDFATALLKGLPIPFCAIVYKTELIKKSCLNVDLYGKIADRPFVFDCAADGKIAVLREPYVQTRVHHNRDSNNFVSGPYVDEWIALIKKYRSLMGSNILRKNGRTFLNRATLNLLVTMNPNMYNELGRKNYIQLAIRSKAITRAGYCWGLPYYLLYKCAKMLLTILNHIIGKDYAK